MAYPSERSNVTVPTYTTEFPCTALPQYQDIRSSNDESVFSDNGTAFLQNSHVASKYESVDEIKLWPQQTGPVYRPWPSGTPNGSVSSLIPAHTGTAQPNGAVLQSIPAAPPLDHQLLLLSLAEDYFVAAHGDGSLMAFGRRDADMQTYYKLIATGLGCLEAVLTNWRLQPQLEAAVRLKYATVLHEETDNATEAEEALNKGIIICDRHKFFDLKYNMQHLLARVLFQQNSRASLKFLDGIIEDVVAYQHIAWIYAFRFLRVSLSLELATHPDTLSALSHIRSIAALSNEHGDKAILAMATTMEAMIHLRQSNSNENIEHAQRALAVARSQQLDPAVGSLPHLAALMQFVDLCSTLLKFDSGQAVAKMQALQTTLEALREDHSQADDGVFAISVAHGGSLGTKFNSGVLQYLPDGKTVLIFNWMLREDVYTLGCLLSGIAMAHRNTMDGQKAEQMFKEGLRSHAKILQQPRQSPQPIEAAASRNAWRQHLNCQLQLHLAFALCARTAWIEAQEQLRQLNETASTLSLSSAATPLSIQILYLSGVIHQGTGNLSIALSIFQSSSLVLPLSPSTKLSLISPLHHDLIILSALNTLLIIRSPTNPSHHLLPTLLAAVTTPISAPQSKSNKALLAAHHLLLATCPPSSSTSSSLHHQPPPTILRTKQHLQSALQLAKQSANNQLMCVTLNVMSWLFFKGVVGGQAEKSAQASRNLAQKCQDRLWGSVASGVLADTLDVAGKWDEAAEARGVGWEIAEGLPGGLWGGGNGEG